MASRHVLVRQILKTLGVYQAGQDLAAEDYRAVDEELPYHATMAGRLDVYDVPDLDHIPDEAVTPLGRYLAQFYLETFGLAGDERARVETAAAQGERDLRYLRTMRPTYARNRAEYF